MHIFPVDTRGVRTYHPVMLEYLGPKIRNLRREKGLTLVEIAGKTGIAQATLSRIETGTMIGTVESHVKIAEVLGVPLAELYTDPDTSCSRVSHTPAHKTAHHGKSIQREMLTPEYPPKKMSPVLTVLQPNTETPEERAPKGTEKFIYLIQGEVMVKTGGESFTLTPGESLYFEASPAHQVKNVSSSPAHFLSVTCQAK